MCDDVTETKIEQAEILRQPASSAEVALLDLHRHLYPEEHKAYWHTRPIEDWPHGWDGFSVLEWTAEEIEWTAEGIEHALREAGVIG